MPVLYLDTETYSECDLKTHGTPRYAADQTTEIMVVQWALDDGEPVVEEHLNPRLVGLLVDPDIIVVIHNSAFDRALIRECWGIDLPPERIDDTMVRAMAHGLPGGLDKIGECLGLPADEQKDKRGKRLIQLFCKPQPKGNKLRRATRETHPAEWAEFLEYSRQDIVTMRSIHHRLPRWNYYPGSPEHALWCLDQRVNDRGFAVDTELARAAIECSGDEQKRLAEETQLRTAGEVDKATRRDALLKHILAHHGVALPDMKKDTLKRRMEDPELPEAVRQLLAIRLEASMTSTGKYQALLRAVSADNRLRNTMQFCGAQRTGRWAGRIFQPQNMMRPNMPVEDIALGIELIKAGCPEVLYPRVMTLTGNAVRGCIVAPPGRKLVIADLANIEGRGLVHLSGEQWKLDAFREFDAGKGADMYVRAYARSFGVKPETVTKDQRQIGKVQELGLGFGGGVAAFITFAAVYDMDLQAMADAVWERASAEAITDATGMYNWTVQKRRSTFGLPQHVYVACEILKRAWRDAHPRTEALWHAAHKAYCDATLNPGETFAAGPLKFRRDGAWLRMRLPSGRYVCYLNPRVEDGGQASYMGISQYTRQWCRQKTYPGKTIAEATQAWARDVLAANLQGIEDDGYEVELLVHDEVIAEVPDSDSYTWQKLAKRMTRCPDWAPGVPLAAAGFETTRYRKE